MKRNLFENNALELWGLFIIEVIIFIMVGKTLAKIKQEPADDLPKPPNYDREAALEFLEKGECIGGTIDEGKFSIFVCKE